jgi:hypothetical protein
MIDPSNPINASATRATIAPLGSYARTTPLPLSSIQRWWWELERVTGPTEHPLRTFPLRGSLDNDELEHSLNEVIRRHEILRTRFASQHADAIPQVQPPDVFKLARVDLSAQLVAERREALRELLLNYRRTRFQLDGGELFRACVARMADDEHVLIVSAHHIIMDAWSFGILLHELGVIYGCRRAQRPSTLPQPRVQYADFAIWESHWLRSAGRADPHSYWDERLANVAPLQLQTDEPRPGGERALPEGLMEFSLPAQAAADFRQMSQRAGTTMSIALMGVFGLLVARWAGRSDVALGCYLSGRSPPGVEGVIGCFACNRPLLLDIDLDDSVECYFQQVRSAGIRTHDLSKPVGMRIAWATALHRVIGNYWKSTGANVPPRESPQDDEPKTVHHDLALHMSDSGAEITVSVSYAAPLFGAERIAAFAASFTRLVQTIPSDTQRTLSALLESCDTFGARTL